jgi:hypothetical protein
VPEERKSQRKSQKWPSVALQLRESRVVHGSRLEQLIRDNQDFELLHPAEATDELPIPLWLRVHWRKQHPDQIPDDSSPAAAYPYPDVLDSVYEWMRIHQDLPRWYPEGENEPPPSSGGEPKASGGDA